MVARLKNINAWIAWVSRVRYTHYSEPLRVSKYMCVYVCACVYVYVCAYASQEVVVITEFFLNSKEATTW